MHSRYNPEKEAERYIRSLSLNESVRYFILVEPGLGYMIEPLRKIAPGAKIIAIHAEDCEELFPPDSKWHPAAGMPLQDFLEKEINDAEAAEIRLLEWRPALAVFGNRYLDLVRDAAAFIKRADANTRTLASFGHVWFRNFFKNLKILRTVLCSVSVPGPVLVTGAGPGLEEAALLIKQEFPGKELFILSAASSVAALEARGIRADMVISTDGGAWAAFHLYECMRAGPGKGAAPLAVSMTAALPSQCGSLPVLPVSDGSFWQELILKELGIPFITLPQRGTVTAAALDIAFYLTEAEVYIAGMDLANSDIRSHARPYSLDRFPEEKACRLNPVYSQAFKRSSLLKAGGSYDIYASWFEKQLAVYPRRLHALGKNNRLFRSPEAGPVSARGGTGGSSGRTTDAAIFKTITLPAEADLFRKGRELLEKYIGDSGYTEKLCTELGELLFTGKAISPANRKSPEYILEAVHSLLHSGPEHENG